MAYEWDERNLGHIARHHVTATEVEEVLNDDASRTFRAWHHNEERDLVYGRTEAGRYLFVVAVTKADEQDGFRVRPITARPMTRSERRRYRRKG